MKRGFANSQPFLYIEGTDKKEMDMEAKTRRLPKGSQVFYYYTDDTSLNIADTHQELIEVMRSYGFDRNDYTIKVYASLVDSNGICMGFVGIGSTQREALKNLKSILPSWW